MPKLPFNAQKRTAVFVDSPNLHYTLKQLDFEIDYERLKRLFKAQTDLVRINFYVALAEDASPNFTAFLRRLSYNGYNVVSKEAKEYVGGDGRRSIRTSVAVDLAIDMLKMATIVEEIVLIAGDGDYCKAVDECQRMGARVIVISSNTTHPPICSDALRRQADEFAELGALRSTIELNRRSSDGALSEGE